MSAVGTPPCEGRVSPFKQGMRRVLLEVHAPGLEPVESVRVSGNTAELGEWNVNRSKLLTKREGSVSSLQNQLGSCNVSSPSVSFFPPSSLLLLRVPPPPSCPFVPPPSLLCQSCRHMVHGAAPGRQDRRVPLSGGPDPPGGGEGGAEDHSQGSLH